MPSIRPDLVFVLNLDFTIIKADGLAICTQVRKLTLRPYYCPFY